MNKSTNKAPIILLHDGNLTIAEGRSRKETRWKNKQIKWSELLTKLSLTKYTGETLEEYKKLQKAEQDAIKDVGGFVGGTLSDQRRKRDTVASRCIITLDADFAPAGLWGLLEKNFNFSMAIYSTHKHSPENPRLRLLIPLSRQVSPEEYEAAARRIAEDIGIDYFDPTTFEPSRLMYWPSTSREGVYEFEYKDSKWLNPEEVLSRYENWRDIGSWPEPKAGGKRRETQRKKQRNPREKSGLLGAFCRTYSVPLAIEKFLSDIYTPCNEGDRYTYARGSGYGGLVIYEDGDFAYSHHGTDPAGGRLLNSFDLVRLHKFGELDDKAGEDTAPSKLPSQKAMLELCSEDDGVKITLGGERLMAARASFEEMGRTEEDSMEWLKLMELDVKGKPIPTIANLVLILENDTYLKGRIGHNEFHHLTMIRDDLPWHELKNRIQGDPWGNSDDANLRSYLEYFYGIFSVPKISDAVLIVEEKNSYHPIRDYLEGLTWDGKERVETLFIDYLGAEDSPYTRTVTRKSLIAAVARIFKPGIKFDYMTVLYGLQGIGKSYLLNFLGKDWYSDSLGTVQGKEAYEQVQSAWIIEMAELSATRKTDVEGVKHFLSKKEDKFRVAYGKRVETFPRQCVFFGTTNDPEFLKDKTGNRRFWPVTVGIQERTKTVEDPNIAEDMDQIWAEAVELWKKGEILYLKGEMLQEALKRQEDHTEESPKEGPIRQYLEMSLPENWANMDIPARRAYIQGMEFACKAPGKIKRDRVCALEIAVELFNEELGKVTQAKSREINEVLRKIEGWEYYAEGKNKLYFGKTYGYQRCFVKSSAKSQSA